MGPDRPNDPDDWLVEPFRWRRLYRIPAGLAMVGCAVAFSVWLTSSGKNEWVVWAIGGVWALWGALIAWEVLLLVLGIIAALFAWDWYQGLSEVAKVGVGIIAFIAFVAYRLERGASAKRAEYERRIAYLEQQVYDLKTRAGWN